MTSPTIIESFDPSIGVEVVKLREAQLLPDGHYFLYEFFADAEGLPASAVQTHWAGQSERSPRRELRQATRVNPEAWRALLYKGGSTALDCERPRRLRDFDDVWRFRARRETSTTKLLLGP